MDNNEPRQHPLKPPMPHTGRHPDLPTFILRALLLSLPLLLLSGCASMIADGMSDGLSQAIVDQDDPQTVRDGAPAFLLMVDGMIAGKPRDEGLLIAGAKLNAAYAAMFVDDPTRALRMTDKARGYALHALCKGAADTCGIATRSHEALLPLLEGLDDDTIEPLFTAATTWLLWIQQRSEDWAAIADLPKVEAMLDRVLALDETYEQGQAHYYLGILRSLRPPSLGGNPEQGRAHFERAIELSHGHNLAAKVAYARYYARLIYEQKLHDRLLNEVIAADPHVPGLTLSNVLAQREARELLASSADYFME